MTTPRTRTLATACATTIVLVPATVTATIYASTHALQTTQDPAPWLLLIAAATLALLTLECVILAVLLTALYDHLEDDQ